MILHNAQFFHNTCFDGIKDAVVILDIDGTLTCSSSTRVSRVVREKVVHLQKDNAVYIFSNNYNSERSRAIARELCIPYIEAPHKKPNRNILNYIEDRTRPVIAIGDKFLTDCLFARFSRVRYIHVRRYRCSTDSLWDRLACIIDDCAYGVVRCMARLKNFICRA